MGGDNVNYGLDIIAEYPETVSGITSDAMVAYIKNDYNTGWMPGDIKLATLIDTDDTDVTGSELVTNGTFDSDVSSWSAYQFTNTNTTISHDTGGDGGRMLVTAAAWYAGATQTITGLTAGETYTATANFVAGTHSQFYLQAVNTSTGSAYASFSGTYSDSNQSITFTLASDQTSVEIRVRSTNGTGTFYVDNISVRLAEEDRSVNGNGLQVFGTVNKNPVATGADLVAYSGFSTTGSKVNYLHMPYNSDLDFDTSFCFMGWIKVNAAVGTQDQHFFDMINADNSSNRVNIFYQHSTNNFTVVPSNGGSNIASATIQFGKWYHVVALANAATTDIYVNGKLSGTGAGGFNHTWPNGYVTLGTRFQEYNSSAYGLNGSMALIRLSKSIPSPEQIAKIYEDEKVLFQENAKATLYGSSDSVTALAYDDDTELLHVGGPQGRSVFQGLRRIDNTTDAVGSAISASNGMVAED